MLVVKEREGDLLLDRLFLVTSLTPEEMSRQEVLAHYRQRGTAEGHMGELEDVLAPALSSTNRAKSHRRGRKPRSASEAVDAFACNEVRLLVSLLAYQLMHIARRAMVRATGTGWSLRRLRERVLGAFETELIHRGLLKNRPFRSAQTGLWEIVPRTTGHADGTGRRPGPRPTLPPVGRLGDGGQGTSSAHAFGRGSSTERIEAPAQGRARPFARLP